MPARKLSYTGQLWNLPSSLQRETMQQLNKKKALSYTVASVTGWAKIPFHRIEDNLGSLPILSNSNSILIDGEREVHFERRKLYSVEVGQKRLDT